MDKRRTMARQDTITIEGRSYTWRQLREVRRQQAEARRAAEGRQLALFELKDDSRPKLERSASGRYEEPTMLEVMQAGWRGAK
jgi:hypothetical protein